MLKYFRKDTNYQYVTSERLCRQIWKNKIDGVRTSTGIYYFGLKRKETK